MDENSVTEPRHSVRWEWYLIVTVLPFAGALVGVIRGIVAAAKDRVGPALALWATAWLSVWLWAAVAVGITAATGDPFNSDDNTPSISQITWLGHDVDGYECDYVDTDSNDLCPANPSYGN
jgi:hypothetical protein